jgi:hypothetical protein
LPQYFKEELFFRQLCGFYFLYISEQKGPLLVVSVIKHIHNNQEYETSAHFMHPDCLLWHYSLTVYYLLSVGFPSGKELALLKMCNQL